jgi:ribosome-associated protein
MLMTLELNKLIIDALEDLKGQKILELDVSQLTDVMDHLIIVNGTSSRHVKSLANNVIEELKTSGHRPLGIEGLDVGEWVLVDYGDTVVHVMLQATRDFYELEKLWSKVPAQRALQRVQP